MEFTANPLRRSFCVTISISCVMKGWLCYQFELKVDLLDTLINCPGDGTVRKLMEYGDRQHT